MIPMSPEECAICGDYTAGGVEVHAMCLTAKPPTNEMTTETIPETRPLRCDAITGQTPGPYGFRPIRCTQVVAVRSYWTATKGWEGLVAYCAIPSHEANVRRRFVEIEPPESADPITAAKGWTDAGWTEAELREAHGG